MNINSISNVSTQLTLSDTSSASSIVTPDPSSSSDQPAVTHISSGGRMMQQLKDLEQSDPAKFKQVVSDMAKKLRADAQSSSGDDANRLSQIADRLDKVASTGDLSQLAPQGASQGQAGSAGQAAGAHHGHHGHGHHGGGGGQSTIGTDLQSALTDALASANENSIATPATAQSASGASAS